MVPFSLFLLVAGLAYFLIGIIGTLSLMFKLNRFKWRDCIATVLSGIGGIAGIVVWALWHAQLDADPVVSDQSACLFIPMFAVLLFALVLLVFTVWWIGHRRTLSI